MKIKKMVGLSALGCALLLPQPALPLKAQLNSPLVEMCYVPRRIVEKLKQSTVMIRTKWGSGSGVVVWKRGRKTYILTNKHVVKRDKKPLIINNGRIYVAKRVLHHPNPNTDLALVEVEGRIGRPVRLAPYSTNTGERIIVVGAPLGFEDSFTTGVISAVRVMNGTEYIQIDAAINPGNSGGGIYNNKGELIAIVTFKVQINNQLAEGLGFGIRITELPPLQRWREVR